MKKNRMMRAASALLVCVLLTTSVISGTFAKYVTLNDGSDSARVAKWGVVITAGGDLYGRNYETGSTSIPSTKNSASELSVMHDGTSEAFDLVAPGTKSEKGLSFSITGTPEVRTEVNIIVSAQDIYLADGIYAVMQPVMVTATTFESKVGSGIYTKSGTTYTKVLVGDVYNATETYYELSNEVTLADSYYPVTYENANTDANAAKATGIAEKIAQLIDSTASDTETSKAIASYDVRKVYDPNTNLGTTLKLDDNTISWEWVFHIDDPTDQKDTILGDLIAGTTVVAVESDTVTVLEVNPTTKIVTKGGTEVGSLATSFGVAITATQVD